MDDLFFYFIHRWMHENKVILKNLRSSKGKENQISITKDNLINEIKKLI